MNFKEFIEHISPIELLEKIEISKNLKYHLENKLSLSDNIFRVYSKSYFDLVNEVRDLYNKNLIAVNDEDAELLETDLGKSGVFNDEVVYLDAPIEFNDEIIEAEHQGKQVKLNKPMRTPGGPKKFKVFVKDGDKVKLVRFGDSKSSGLSIKNNSPARAKSFRARHKCSEKKDRTTPGYWSCNIARHAKSLGLKSDRPW
jgi:hypothetical protein